MPQLTEAAAGQLTPGQAAELVRVLDAHAAWDDRRPGPTGGATPHADLRARQRAFDTFRSAWRGYAPKYPGVPLPEPGRNSPDQLAAWCRVLRVVFRLAAAWPARVMDRVHRLADGVSAGAGEHPVGRTTAGDEAEAGHDLDAVIAWCDRAAKPPAPPRALTKARREGAA
ncbi:hypothetical protein [Gemmata sp.]|uniref:hypothetical protein n=1 Tax=Gemmata sp. TaxID=1914242 RepID=UPI003F725DA3